MEKIMELAVNNGLGVVSFLALLYFMFTTWNDISKTLKDISATQLLMQNNLEKLTDRINDIEYRIKED